MNQQEKYKFAFQLTSVASSVLDFVKQSLAQIMNNNTDLAYLRSLKSKKSSLFSGRWFCFGFWGIMEK
jgi:hypothetical protein